MDHKSPSLGGLCLFSLLPFHPQVQHVPQVPATIFCPTFPGCLATGHSPGRSVSLGQVPFVPPTVVEFALVFPGCETNRLQPAAFPLLPSAPAPSRLTTHCWISASHPCSLGFSWPSLFSCGVVCATSAFLPGLLSHCGDSHDEFSAAALCAPLFMRSQVTQDVQNGVSTVVL